MRIEAVVTDIEGTTTDIGFVHRVLFPYAARALPAYVAAHRAEPALQALLRDVAVQSGRPEASEAEIVDQLLEWINSLIDAFLINIWEVLHEFRMIHFPTIEPYIIITRNF